MRPVNPALSVRHDQGASDMQALISRFSSKVPAISLRNLARFLKLVTRLMKIVEWIIDLS
jgi:hypothetical protein